MTSMDSRSTRARRKARSIKAQAWVARPWFRSPLLRLSIHEYGDAALFRGKLNGQNLHTKSGERFQIPFQFGRGEWRGSRAGLAL
jgi:hypothetical protein